MLLDGALGQRRPVIRIGFEELVAERRVEDQHLAQRSSASLDRTGQTLIDDQGRSDCATADTRLARSSGGHRLATRCMVSGTLLA